MSEKIEPALSAEEWARGWTNFALDNARMLLIQVDERYTPYERHALAALALHEQPFGFSWEDVDALLCPRSYEEEHDQDALDDLAGRIAALLPPKETPDD